MLNLRKKHIKNLQNNTYITFYYLYLKHKFLLNCGYYQNSILFFNYLLILKNFVEIFKFQFLKTSKNLTTLRLRSLILKNLYFVIKYGKITKFFKINKKFLLKNLKKIIFLTRDLEHFICKKKLFLFHKRWSLL